MAHSKNALTDKISFRLENGLAEFINKIVDDKTKKHQKSEIMRVCAIRGLLIVLQDCHPYLGNFDAAFEIAKNQVNSFQTKIFFENLFNLNNLQSQSYHLDSNKDKSERREK